jgi:predicted dithiol-disulfide oxidoreductase (DUF899 family)
MIDYAEGAVQLRQHRDQIKTIREKMRAVQAAMTPLPVSDYALATAQGPVRLSELFGDHEDLIVIFNMGASCPYCTLWADGFNGVYDHLASRAAFVVTSPEAPEAQARFAATRGWRFPMASHAGTSFAADMGFRSESGGLKPGIAVFRRKGDGLVRLSDTGFGPGDDFCAVWHILDLLPEGPAGWTPKYRYN